MDYPVRNFFLTEASSLRTLERNFGGTKCFSGKIARRMPNCPYCNWLKTFEPPEAQGLYSDSPRPGLINSLAVSCAKDDGDIGSDTQDLGCQPGPTAFQS